MMNRTSLKRKDSLSRGLGRLMDIGKKNSPPASPSKSTATQLEHTQKLKIEEELLHDDEDEEYDESEEELYEDDVRKAEKEEELERLEVSVERVVRAEKVTVVTPWQTDKIDDEIREETPATLAAEPTPSASKAFAASFKQDEIEEIAKYGNVLDDFAVSFDKYMVNREKDQYEFFSEDPMLSFLEGATLKLEILKNRALKHRLLEVSKMIEKERQDNIKHVNKNAELLRRIQVLEKENGEKSFSYNKELVQLHQSLNEMKRKYANSETHILEFGATVKKAAEQLNNKEDKINKLKEKKEESNATERILLLEEKSSIADQLIKDLLLALDNVGKKDNDLPLPLPMRKPTKLGQHVTIVTDNNKENGEKDIVSATSEGKKDEMLQISKEIKDNQVREVDITPALSVTYEQIEAFATALSGNTSVTSISFNRNNIGDQGVKLVTDSLKNHKSIHSITFEACNITNSGVSSIIGLVESNSNIKSVNLNSNLLNNKHQEFAKLISKFLQQNLSNLERLSIGGNMLSVEGIKEISKQLDQNTSLNYLDISGNLLGSEGISILAQSLIDNKTLTSLNIWGNQIAHEGMKNLAEALKVNSTIKILNLKGNNLRVDGAKHLATALESNTSITFLDISGNALGPEGIKALLPALKSTKSITDLNLGGNNLGEEGMTSISELLICKNSIKNLNLELNLIDDNGAKKLGPSLVVNKSLQHLDLSYNRIGENGAHILHDNLSTFLKSVLFHGNALTEIADLCQVPQSYFDKSAPPTPELSKSGLSKKRDPSAFLLNNRAGTPGTPGGKRQISMSSLFLLSPKQT